MEEVLVLKELPLDLEELPHSKEVVSEDTDTGDSDMVDSDMI